MTDHAHELRRYARKIAHPAGDVPAVMRAAADEIERLAAKLEAAEKERDALRAKIEAMERQAPAMWANSSNIISARISTERGSAGDQHTCSETKTAYHDAPLYLAPGAKGE